MNKTKAENSVLNHIFRVVFSLQASYRKLFAI